MDSFKKKVVPRNQPERKTTQPNVTRLNQTAFRQIQQQFSKNRTNNEKVMESLERINAASLERNIKTERVLTEESFEQSAIELYSSPTAQLQEFVGSTLNNDEKAWSGVRSTKQKTVSELAFGNISKVSSRKPTTRPNRTMVVDTVGLMMTQPDQELAQLRSSIHQQYKRKLYDHEVYIKQLLRESSELNEAWGRSRQMLHQSRLEKESVQRELRKDRQEYGLLKEVLIKQNQYYKCQLRIAQRETAQLRERLNKLAGLRSAADQMQEISEDQPTEQEQQLVEKLQQLERTVKDYAQKLYRAKQYELQIQQLNGNIVTINNKLEKAEQQLSEQKRKLTNQQTAETFRLQALRTQLQQQSQRRLGEVNIQLTGRICEIARLNVQLEQLSAKCNDQEKQMTVLQAQALNSAENHRRLADEAASKQQSVLHLELELTKFRQQLVAQSSRSEQLISSLNAQFSEEKKQISQSSLTLQLKIEQMVDQNKLLVEQCEDLKGKLREVQQTAIVQTIKNNEVIEQEAQTIQQTTLPTNSNQEFQTNIKSTLSKLCLTPITIPPTCKTYNQTSACTEEDYLNKELLLEQKQQELMTLEKHNQCLQSELQRTLLELGKTREQVEEMAVNEQNLTRQIQSYAAIKDQSEEQTGKQVVSMLQKIQSLQEQLEKNSYNRQSIEKKYDLIVEEFERFRSQYDTLTEVHEDLEGKLERLQADLAQKEQHIQQLTKETKRMQQRNQELNNLQVRECEECKRMEKEVNRLDSELRSTKYGYEDRIIKIEDENENLKNAVTRIRAFSKEAF